MASKKERAISVFGKTAGVSDIVGVAFLISILIGLPYFILFARQKLIVQSDLVSFITGAQMVKNGMKDKLYDLAVQEGFQNKVIYPFSREAVLPFKNFAPYVLPFIPFTFLSLKTSYIIFAFVNLGLLIALSYSAAKMLPKLTKFRLWFLAPFVFLPTILSVILGQLSVVLTLIYFLIYKFLKQNKNAAAGIICGILLIKPQYVIFVPFIFFLSKNRKRFALGFFATILALFLSTLFLSGPNALASYPSFLLATENASFGQRAQRMFTINSTIYYALTPFGISFVSTLWANALLYFASLYLFAKRCKNLPYELAYVCATILSLLFAVHVLEHDLSILLVCVLILISFSQRYYEQARKWYIFASILFIMPLLILIISPPLGTLLAVIVAISLLFNKERALI